MTIPISFTDVERPRITYESNVARNLTVTLKFPRGARVTVTSYPGVWRVYGPHPDYDNHGEGYDYYLEPADMTATVLANIHPYGIVSVVEADMALYQPI